MNKKKFLFLLLYNIKSLSFFNVPYCEDAGTIFMLVIILKVIPKGDIAMQLF